MRDLDFKPAELRNQSDWAEGTPRISEKHMKATTFFFNCAGRSCVHATYVTFGTLTAEL
jgi:hypothetical protein